MTKRYDSLRDFIDFLEDKGLLVRIQEEVNIDLEITEIHQRVLKAGGPALLFENVMTKNGRSNIPVLVNLFGTIERVAMGMGLNSKDQLRDFGKKLAFLKNPQAPNSFKETINMIPVIKNILQMKPKIIKNAPCQEIRYQGNEIDLSKFPIQNCWPLEPSPLITWPIVITKGPNHEKIDSYNLGIYRMQVISPKQTLMRWLKHRGGAEHERRWKSKNNMQRMPVAVVIGIDPATIISAVTPIPENISEYQFAGLIREKKLELVKCITIPIEVPAHAEIVLEGYIDLNNYGEEGPYGDHTGYYNSKEFFPIFDITAITTRKNPIYLSTFTARPPDEPSILGEALNEVFIPLLQQQFPEIIDFYLPPEGCSYRICVVSMKKSYPGHAKRIFMGIWSFLKQFMYTKFIIIVDEDINIRKWEEVIWAVSTRMDFERDVTIIKNTPIDYLDFASPVSELGAKIAFDATNKIYPAETLREWGTKINMNEEIIDLVNKKWQKYNISL